MPVARVRSAGREPARLGLGSHHRGRRRREIREPEASEVQDSIQPARSYARSEGTPAPPPSATRRATRPHPLGGWCTASTSPARGSLPSGERPSDGVVRDVWRSAARSHVTFAGCDPTYRAWPAPAASITYRRTPHERLERPAVVPGHRPGQGDPRASGGRWLSRLHRRLDRQHRPPGHPQRPRLLGPGSAVGDQRLPAYLRRLHAARRPAGRPGRPTTRPGRRHRRVRGRLPDRRPLPRTPACWSAPDWSKGSEPR